MYCRALVRVKERDLTMRSFAKTTRAVAEDAEARGGSTGAIAPGTDLGEVQRFPVDVPLATLQAQTSGVPFSIFSVPALPSSSYKLMGAEIEIIQALAAPGLTTTQVELGNAATPGRIIAQTTVSGLTGFFATPGTNPFQSAAGAIDLTVTLGVAAMAALTNGHIQVNLYFAAVSGT
jgi:hypothetical protein